MKVRVRIPEEDTSGHLSKWGLDMEGKDVTLLTPSGDEVKGHAARYGGLSEEDDDTSGQGSRFNGLEVDIDDTSGQGSRFGGLDDGDEVTVRLESGDEVKGNIVRK